jgi:hypothetical protein
MEAANYILQQPAFPLIWTALGEHRTALAPISGFAFHFQGILSVETCVHVGMRIESRLPKRLDLYY